MQFMKNRYKIDNQPFSPSGDFAIKCRADESFFSDLMAASKKSLMVAPV